MEEDYWLMHGVEYGYGLLLLIFDLHLTTVFCYTLRLRASRAKPSSYSDVGSFFGFPQMSMRLFKRSHLFRISLFATCFEHQRARFGGILYALISLSCMSEILVTVYARSF